MSTAPDILLLIAMFRSPSEYLFEPQLGESDSHSRAGSAIMVAIFKNQLGYFAKQVEILPRYFAAVFIASVAVILVNRNVRRVKL